MPISKYSPWIVLIALAATVVVYSGGLNGPFLFDDHIHITQNRWVKIEALDTSSLVQAWNSSFSAFPANRPLAQLSFGINHAISGLDPWAFKTTNLVIHLLSGLMVFVFTRLVFRALGSDEPGSRRETYVAVATAAFWLLAPLHVSTVLYTVQRMAQLSTLALLLALSSYFWGRLQIAAGKSGAAWIFAAVPIALVGFLGKENTVLLPLILLACELTVLRSVSIEQKKNFVRGVWVLFIALPLMIGIWYLLTHPALTYYGERPFTMIERVLTEPRVLWFYLRLMLVPDISAFGLFHDDLALSKSLFNPVSTFVALIALIGLAIAALAMRKRAPVFAFAVLFFLACHALESSVIALEIVFEHRNYLASVGPFFFLAHVLLVSADHLNVRRVAMTMGALLLAGHTAVTYQRVDNWSSYQSYLLSAAANHPNSPRSNFMAAKLMISAIAKAEGEAPELADNARELLHRGLAANPRCLDCLFGLMVLDLHLDKQPEADLIAQLIESIRSGHVGPTQVSISHFSYLVKWHQADGIKLAPGVLESIFDAALENPRWNHTGRAGIEAAYREYYEFVKQDLPKALQHAESAIRIWPDQWAYRMAAIRILQKLGRIGDAIKALDGAEDTANNPSQRQQVEELRTRLERARRD